jgi:hypothetical protein
VGQQVPQHDVCCLYILNRQWKNIAACSFYRSSYLQIINHAENC